MATHESTARDTAPPADPRLGWQTVLFYGVIAAAAGVTMLLPLHQGYQRTLMRSRQLDAADFTTWAALQLIPTMYNFANECWFSPEPITPADHAAAVMLNARNTAPEPYEGIASGVHSVWLNHYPSRMITSGLMRKPLMEHAGAVYFTARSRYRGQTVETHYQTEPAEQALRIIPLGGGR